MTTVFLDEVFKPFFKIVHDTGQQLTIDRTNFLTDGFLQIIQRTGFVSVNTRFQIPQRKKSHVERSGERGGHGMSPKREMRCPGKMLRTMVIDSFAVCTVAPSCWNHTLAQFILLRHSSEYCPFKRCQVPVGHPVYKKKCIIVSTRTSWCFLSWVRWSQSKLTPNFSKLQFQYYAPIR